MLRIRLFILALFLLAISGCSSGETHDLTVTVRGTPLVVNSKYKTPSGEELSPPWFRAHITYKNETNFTINAVDLIFETEHINTREKSEHTPSLPDNQDFYLRLKPGQSVAVTYYVQGLPNPEKGGDGDEDSKPIEDFSYGVNLTFSGWYSQATDTEPVERYKQEFYFDVE